MSARLIKLVLLLILSASASNVARAQRVVPHDGEAPLTNSSVVKLVRAGFREKTVITIINARPASFDLTPERLIELKKSGVSEKIILAMLAREDGGGSSFTSGDEWESDEEFFKQGKSRNGSGDDSTQGETGIFGSSSGSRSRSRTETSRGGGSGDTQTNGSATVRILRPPAEAGAAPPKLERTPTLTNSSVVELVEAGFSEGTIIRRIEQSPVEFDLAEPKLAELRRRRVSEPVINAMRNAMADDATQPEKR
ncbi:MAG TPA: hypothetical protein VNA19_08985 [Pyrinomonadaceae bacterium]|jgi:hypothetical protein|nr:hypothetical protein [Pyrinomonadaceae bacterium]